MSPTKNVKVKPKKAKTAKKKKAAPEEDTIPVWQRALLQRRKTYRRRLRKTLHFVQCEEFEGLSKESQALIKEEGLALRALLGVMDKRVAHCGLE